VIASRERAPLAEAGLSAVDSGRKLRAARSDAQWLKIRGRGWLVRRALLAADVFGLSAAFILGELVAGPSHGGQGRYDQAVEVALFLVAVPAWIVAAKLVGLYDRDEDRADHSTADDVMGVVQLLTFGTWIAFAGVSVLDIGDPQLRKFFVFWAAAAFFVPLGRALARAFCRRHPAYIQNAVVVGAGDVGQTVARKILQHPEYGIRVVGFVDSVPKTRENGLAGLPLLGDPADLPQLVQAYGVERVIIAFSIESHERTLALIRALRDFYVQIDVVPRLFELVPPTADIHTLEGMSLIGLPRLRLSQSSLVLKRAMDLALASAGLIVLAPLFALIALAIKLDSRGPVLFRQVRIGRHDRRFMIFKFRTMVLNAEERKREVAHLSKHENGRDPRMFKVPGDPRATRVGRVLRSYSLDELPQLLNVLKGDMSLVGPRPLIPDEHEHVEDWALARIDLQPGITGLWQVSGRDAIPFGEMVRLDYFYVTTWSLWNDLQIMFRTLAVLRKGERALDGA
jgi:exopolysaccharide biosynthesis polyprenyl glycosylphosphotransferase